MSFDVYQAQGLRIFQADNATVSAYVGNEGEIAINTENKSIHILDGVTPGGIEIKPAISGVLATTNTFEGANRGVVTEANNGTFDLSATNNFSCAPTTPVTLTFTGVSTSNGQGGNIYVDNSNGMVISAHSNTHIHPSALTTLSTAGKYWVSYYCNGEFVMVTTTGNLG